MLTYFGMIWNYEKKLKQNRKYGKVFVLSNICIFPNLIVKYIWHIEATINTIYEKFQNI
jgi:hypothetical protein